MADPRINRVSVYLIKKHVFLEEVLKKKLQVHKIEIPNSGILFVGEARINPPKWIRSFFPDAEIDYEKLKIFNSYPSAVFLTKIDTGNNEERVFAITFGGGWQMIEGEAIEDNFGLRTTLNLINPKGLKSIDKKNLSLVQKRSRENIGKEGVVSDFGVDIDQDLIQSVVGRSKDRSFGTTLSGKDSLHLSIEIDMNNLKEKLADYYKAYNSEEYKNNFSWIDQVKEISNKSLIIRLNERVVSAMKENEITEKMWLSIPDVINWEDVAGFKYGNKKETLYPDLYLADFKAVFADENLELDLLKRTSVNCMSVSKENTMYSWKVFKCLYAEIEDNGNRYILNGARWYQIDKEFYDAVSEDYSSVPLSDIKLPDCPKDKNESEYIKWVSDNNDYACLDGARINYDGHSSIEFCDLLSPNNEIIHVKRYGGSSVLNNMFGQAVISGRLFLTDPAFRKRINSRLVENYKLKDIENKKIDSSKYKIVIGVISSSEKDLIEMPFFSKVSLRSTRRMLEAFGYDVSFKKIYSLEKGLD
ncbi:MAG: TIGR04141 family sporadically distributed protein [Candidatus Pacebacteria bacterium]|nr:TIGR04141 family sporadically distributed protein [Candidatus Paceibacterota bacterium]